MHFAGTIRHLRNHAIPVHILFAELSIRIRFHREENREMPMRIGYGLPARNHPFAPRRGSAFADHDTPRDLGIGKGQFPGRLRNPFREYLISEADFILGDKQTNRELLAHAFRHRNRDGLFLYAQGEGADLLLRQLKRPVNDAVGIALQFQRRNPLAFRIRQGNGNRAVGENMELILVGI